MWLRQLTLLWDIWCLRKMLPTKLCVSRKCVFPKPHSAKTDQNWDCHSKMCEKAANKIVCLIKIYLHWMVSFLRPMNKISLNNDWFISSFNNTESLWRVRCFIGWQKSTIGLIMCEIHTIEKIRQVPCSRIRPITLLGWETKNFWHSPELGSVLYTKFHLPRPVLQLARPYFHWHWRAGER